MRSPAARWLPLLVLLAVLAIGAAAPGAAAVPTAGGPDEDAPTTMWIAIQPDGDARWTVTARFVLESANDTRGFDRLATSFEAGEADVLSADPFRTAATRAERTTDRTMAIENVSRRAARAGGIGRLSLSFRWTAFARVTGQRIEFGDAFRTPSGTWLPRLGPNQELVVVFPEGYAPVSTSHQLVNGTFRIEGPTTFRPGEPSAALVRQASPPPTTATTTVTTTGGGTDTPTPTEPPVEAFTRAAGIGAVLVVAIALAVLAYRRREGFPTTTDGDGTAAEPPASGAPDDAAGDEGEPLLSDEERVLRLLEENDGRMKQAAIVTETDWSNAKVSQLLSEMDDRDEIDKLRIGRENLISLPDETPEEFE